MILTLLLAALVDFANAQQSYPDIPHIPYDRNPYYESEGFKLGFVVDLHRDGFFVYSYEGRMMVGFGADKGDANDPICMSDAQRWIDLIENSAKREKAMNEAREQCYTLTEPWEFSTLDRTKFEQYSRMDKVQYTPVLLYYLRPTISIQHLITRTKNFVMGIYPVAPDFPIQKIFSLTSSEMPIGSHINVRQGFVDGRVVNASLENMIRKSFEVTIQQGPYGNIFRKMSVSDQKMFDFIVTAMSTGKILRIGYLEITGLENKILRIGRDYRTPYRVISVEVREDQPSTDPPGLTPRK